MYPQSLQECRKLYRYASRLQCKFRGDVVQQLYIIVAEYIGKFIQLHFCIDLKLDHRHFCNNELAMVEWFSVQTHITGLCV